MRFYIHKLGCPKNDIDADYLTARLIDAGGENCQSPDNAEIIIVNTCGFILPAREESINEILRLVKMKETGSARSLFVTGCLAQRYGDELLKEMPELDGAFGLGELDAIAEAVNGAKQLKKTQKTETRFLSYLDYSKRHIADSFPYAYLKLSDGCDRHCSYCAIPSIRGSFRSRPMASILKEAEFLSQQGKKELILVSQDSTMWGSDLQGKPTPLALLQELDKLDNVNWIRLMYIHPVGLSDDLIDYVLDSKNKTVPYFDLPLQHINDRILSAMKRCVSREKIETLLRKIQQNDTKGTIRTTFIVGFPGETQQEFDELADFVEKWEFDRMGVFPYSLEEGTVAASLKGHLTEPVKNERVDILMTLQRDIAFRKNEQMIGLTCKVIIDSFTDGEFVGRTQGDCPDIDQQIYVKGENIRVGDISMVRVESTDGYDLRGTVKKE